MVNKIQGYVVLSDNDPSGRGLYYFTLDKAKEFKERCDKNRQNYPDGFNLEFWKEPPTEAKIYSVVIEEEIK